MQFFIYIYSKSQVWSNTWSNNDCLQEEVVHLGKFLVNDVSFMSNTELDSSHLPPLGSRVRRGPDWRYNNQDQGGPGTVVGHDRGTA